MCTAHIRWASGAQVPVDFIGIDAYFPLSDWRDGVAHLDASIARSVHDVDYLRARVASGEAFDWFYADDAARDEARAKGEAVMVPLAEVGTVAQVQTAVAGLLLQLDPQSAARRAMNCGSIWPTSRWSSPPARPSPAICSRTGC